MPFCPNCGKEVAEGSSFCPECGQRLEKLSTPEKSREQIEELQEKPLMTAQGKGGSLELYENKIRIKRKGVSSLILQGMKGDKDIFLSQISSIQLKKAGLMTNGYIQFAFVGGHETKGGLFNATRDENTLIFTSNQQKEIEAFKSAVEQKLFAPKPLSQTTSSLNDLEKLHELKAKGIITKEEFNQKKKHILGN